MVSICELGFTHNIISFQLIHVPTQFGQVDQSFYTSGFLDISGPGVHVPDIHLDRISKHLCGPVNLLIVLDGTRTLSIRIYDELT